MDKGIGADFMEKNCCENCDKCKPKTKDICDRLVIIYMGYPVRKEREV